MELLADRDPEEARQLLDPVLERMMAAVHRYEGTVNQVMGDGIMALFGAPLAHEDHAVRACYAALAMQEAVGQYAEGVRRQQGLDVQMRVAHLATGGDYYAQVIQAALEGVPRLPWGARMVEEYRTARTAASHQLVAAGPQALVRGFEAHAAHLQDVLASLQTDDLAKPAQMARSTTPIGCMIHARLSELTVHDWDIRQPHDAEARLSPPAVSAVLTALQENLVALLAPRLTDGLNGVHVFRAGDVSWALAVEGQTVTYLAQAPTTCDTCVSTDAESLILLTMGWADPEAKRHSGALTVTGDAAKRQHLCATLFRAL